MAAEVPFAFQKLSAFLWKPTVMVFIIEMPKNMAHFEFKVCPFWLVYLLSKCHSKEMSVKLFCLYLSTYILQRLLDNTVSIFRDPCQFYKPSEGNFSQINSSYGSAIITNFTQHERSTQITCYCPWWVIEVVDVLNTSYFVIWNTLEQICSQIKAKQFDRHFLTKALTK